mgnify:CR=1 FL=1
MSDHTGEERRRSSDEDIGYMRARVDQNSQDIKEIKGLIRAQTIAQAKNTKELTDNLKKVTDELSVYKAIIRLAKLMGASALLVMTFKFGDVSSLWQAK